MILHEKVRSEALAIKHDANAVTLAAGHLEGFTSAALERLHKERSELDPFKDETYVDDCNAFDRLCKKSDPKIDALIELLTVECLTAHMLRETKLVHRLMVELKVDVRRCWRPDEKWLAGFQKIQLAHLLAEFRGGSYRRRTRHGRSPS